MSRTPIATWDTAWMLMARTLLPSVVDLPQVSEQPLRQLLWTGQRRQVPTVHLVGLDPEALPHDASLEVGGEEPVVATEQEPGRHVGPLGQRPRISERRARLRVHVVLRPAGQGVGRVVQDPLDGSSDASGPRASACPVFVHHSLPDSPGRGTIAATRTISITGTRSHTSGATNPDNDC